MATMIAAVTRDVNPSPGISTIPPAGRSEPAIQLADHSLPAQDMHAVCPSPKLVPSKVTSFIDFLQHELAGEWWRRAVQAPVGGTGRIAPQD
jgi:DNA-binding transcriptional LysR family regulator